MTSFHSSRTPSTHRARLTRRDALGAFALLLLGRCAANADETFHFDELDAELSPSLEALAARQNEDGSFGAETELFGRDPGVAGLCGLAFLASGSAPGRGRFGRAIALAVDFVLAHSTRDAEGTDSSALEAFPGLSEYLRANEFTRSDLDGLVANYQEKGRKPLYGHGFATLFLAETLGTTSRSEHRERLTAAVRLIERTQNSEGGWRYEPKRVEAADLSVTTCQLTALRAAKNAGVRVQTGTIERGLDFVRSLQNSDGGFRYMSSPGPSGYGRTAAAICALQSGGAESDETIARGFEYMETIYPGSSQERPTVEYLRYAMFYASLAYWRASTVAPKGRSREFYERLRRDTLAQRGSDMLWSSNTSTDSDTAFAILSLAIPREGAPFFLR